MNRQVTVDSMDLLQALLHMAMLSIHIAATDEGAELLKQPCPFIEALERALTEANP